MQPSLTYKEIVKFGFGQCNKCGIWKSSDRFPKAKKFCKDCQNQELKKYLSKHTEKLIRYRKNASLKSNERSKRYRETLRGKCKTLAFAAIGRAKRENLPCDITWELIEIMMVSQNLKCAQTGISFDFETKGTSSKHRKLTAPSIDKIDASKGYVIGNVQIVCWFYNAAKGTSSDGEVWELLTEAIENKRRS